MKKLLVFAFCIVLTLTLVACSDDAKAPETTEPTAEAPTTEAPTTEMPTEEDPTEGEPIEEMSFLFEHAALDAAGQIYNIEPTEDMLFVQSLFEGLEPLIGTAVPEWFIMNELPADAYECDVFTAYADGMTAIRCEPAIHIHPGHSIVVLTVPEGTDVEAVRADIEANANPKKFICTSAEQVHVVASGNTILLVMSTPEVANTIVSNFFAKLEG